MQLAKLIRFWLFIDILLAIKENGSSHYEVSNE